MEQALPPSRKKGNERGAMSEEKANILIVDDSPLNLIAMEAILGDLNQNVVKARSGQEALRLTTQQAFALIFLDVNMPTMDGYDTAAALRLRKGSEKTPIIFVTAATPAESYQVYRGYSLGAVDYIFSPLVAEVVRAKAAIFIDLFQKNQQLKKQSEMALKTEGKKIDDLREQLRQEMERSRFYHLSQDLLGICDYDGIIRQTNETWQKVLGFSETEMKGRIFLEMVHSDERKEAQAQMERLQTMEERGFFETRFGCKTRDHRWLAWTVAPWRADQLLYLFARDITEFKSTAKWQK